MRGNSEPDRSVYVAEWFPLFYYVTFCIKIRIQLHVKTSLDPLTGMGGLHMTGEW